MAHKPSTSEKGQSLVELSLVFTLLLLLVGGVIDLGGMFYTSVALRDTVQEGVIFGATHPTDTAGITNRIVQSASFPIDASRVTGIQVTCPDNTNGGPACTTSDIGSCQGNDIMVRIQYNYHPMSPLFIFQQVPLSATVAGTILNSNTIGCPPPKPSPTQTPVTYP